MANNNKINTDRKLKLISLNVHGLRNPKRRKVFFNQFRKKDYDIITLQETYLLNNEKKIIEKEWGGIFHIAEGTTHSKGLITLFNPAFKEEEIHCILVNDRTIISKVTINNNNFNIANIYAPCIENEKELFLKNLSDIINKKINIHEENTILMGDWNMVRSNKLDIVSGLPHPKKSIINFNNFLEELSLIDIWRSQNPETKNYTYSKFNNSNSKFIARRLDFIFINQPLIAYCHKADIHTIGFSDHRAVTLNLDFSPT